MNDENNNVAKNLAVIFYFCIGVFSVFFFVKVLQAEKQSRPLPCAVSEISPDVTAAEREQCRLIRGHKL
jgi:hypothetical protein